MAVGAGQVAALDEVAVGEEDRRLRLRRLDAGGEDREHVRPVEIVGDAAEALRLALGAPGAARPVEAHQPGVCLRIELGDDLQFERSGGHRADGEHLRHRGVAVGGEAGAVERHRQELQFVADEDERLVAVAVPPEREPGTHDRLLRKQMEIQRHRVDGEIGLAIIGETDRRRVGFHRG